MNIRLAQAADCAAIAHIQIDSYRTAYAPLLPAEYLAAFSYEEQEQDWKDLLAAGRVGELLFVAEARLAVPLAPEVRGSSSLPGGNGALPRTSNGAESRQAVPLAPEVRGSSSFPGGGGASPRTSNGAESQGQILGYLLARQTDRAETGFDSEVVALHVRPGEYRRGIGRALLAEAARRLHGLGCASLNLWVLEGNPASGFYAHLGGRPAGEQFFEIEELRLRRREVGYAWEDIRVLFEK